CGLAAGIRPRVASVVRETVRIERGGGHGGHAANWAGLSNACRGRRACCWRQHEQQSEQGAEDQGGEKWPGWIQGEIRQRSGGLFRRGKVVEPGKWGLAGWRERFAAGVDEGTASGRWLGLWLEVGGRLAGRRGTGGI